MMRLGETLSRWLHKGRNDSSNCPACETSLPPERSFCPHCYIVLRPEGMAELHRTLQGAKVREDIYILRKLHQGDQGDVISSSHDPPPQFGSLPSSATAGGIPARPPAERTRIPTGKPDSRSRTQRTQGAMTYALPTSPSVGLEDLPSLIRWFLNHDRHTPNNLEILEEAYRIRYGAEDSRTYERHLAWTIADDLCSYNSADLLQEHLILLTTIYARTLQALRRLGPHQIDPRSSDAFPEPDRQEMWELCLRLGLTATRLRVEGWIYQLQYGEPPNIEKVNSKRRSRVRAQGGDKSAGEPQMSG